MKGNGNIQIRKISGIIQSYFSDRPEIAGIYLFGSVLRNTFTKDSDIDIGVLFQENSKISWELTNQDKAALNDLLHTEVDLVCLNDASPILKYQVLKSGQCILHKQPAAINRFFVRTINEYFDLKLIRHPIESRLGQVKIL